MRIVTDQLEVFEFEILNVFVRRIQFHPRQRSTIARKLFAGLVEMVFVKMQVTKGMDEITRRKIDNLRHHHREQRVRRDVEWHSKKEIAAALVKLATQLAVLDIELEEDVTRRQSHFVDLGGVPRAHNKPPAQRVRFDLRDDVVDLIDADAIFAAPIPPLGTINPTEVTVFISPFVPDRDAVL